MSTSKNIVLYDIPFIRKGEVWSPNTWKVRYVLNYKGIPYTTVWVEFPDIERVCKEIGAPPTGVATSGKWEPAYSVPVIHDPSTNTTIAESFDIVLYLEKTYLTTPRLIPAETVALHAAFDMAFTTAVVSKLLPVAVPASYEVLNPASQAYFRKTREVIYGKRLEDISPLGPTRDEHRKQIVEGLHTVAGWLSKNGEGDTFVMGKDISYADFIIAGWLRWIKVVFGVDSEQWKDIETSSDGLWSVMMQKLDLYGEVKL